MADTSPAMQQHQQQQTTASPNHPHVDGFDHEIAALIGGLELQQSENNAGSSRSSAERAQRALDVWRYYQAQLHAKIATCDEAECRRLADSLIQARGSIQALCSSAK